MLEKLSVDFVRKLFSILTNGNAQIKFYTICMQNQDREKAANRPVEFGLKLLGYNVWYRLPLLRDLPVGRRIGHDYLTRHYLRLPVEDLASEILENPHAVCDVEGSLLLPIWDEKRFFEKLERAFDCPGFARLRRRLEKPGMSIQAIYQAINQALSVNLSWAKELELARQNRIPNRYVIRLLDIAAYHQVSIHLTVDSCYPASFYEELLQKNGVTWDSLGVSCETGKSKTQMAEALHLEKFGAVSADFNGFLRPLVRRGAKGIYYREPAQLMKDAAHPWISSDFQVPYDHVCGARVFSGGKRPPFLYELGYLCAGPLVYSLLFPQEGLCVCHGSRHSLVAMLAGPHTVCTLQGAKAFSQTHIRVLDTGRADFPAFLKSLQKSNPQAQIQVVSLAETVQGEDSPLACLFGEEPSDLSDGIRDFCREYTRFTGCSPISLEDALRLYRAGQRNMERLLAEREISAGTTVSV